MFFFVISVLVRGTGRLFLGSCHIMVIVIHSFPPEKQKNDVVKRPGKHFQRVENKHTTGKRNSLSKTTKIEEKNVLFS